MDRNKRKNLRLEYEYHDQSRNATDVLYIMLFALIFSTWLFGVTYIFFTTDTWKLSFNETKFSNISKGKYGPLPFEALRNETRKDSLYNCTADFIDIVNAAMSEFLDSTTSIKYILPAVQLLVAIVSVGCLLILMRCCSKLCSYIGIGCAFIMAVGSIYLGYTSVAHFNSSTAFSTLLDAFIIILFVYLITYCVVSLICNYVITVGISILMEVIKKTSRAIFKFPHLTFFVISNYLMMVFVALLSIVSLTTLGAKSFLFYVILIEAVYLISFIYNYGRAVIHLGVATWLWRKNENKCSVITLSGSIITVTRYHFGSIAFGATYILPLGAALVSLFKMQTADKRKPTFSRFVDALLTFYLFFNITEFASIYVIVSGRNFYEATGKTITDFRKESKLYIAFFLGFRGFVFATIFSIIMLIVIPSTLAGWLLQPALILTQLTPVPIPFLPFFSTAAAHVATIGLAVFLLPAYVVLKTIGHAYFVCTAGEDQNNVGEEDTSTMKPLAVIAS